MKKCSKCKREAIYFRINEGRYYCEKCFSENIEKRVKSVISKYKLVSKKDKIAVALSGGKDSSNTVYLLKKIFGKNPNVDIVAITVDEGIKGYRNKVVKGCKKFCDELGVEHYLVSFKERFNLTVDEIGEKTKDEGTCGPCGILRRYLLNEKARELKAKKIAVGHNLDDEAQSVIMNFMKGDLIRLARFGALPGIKVHSKFIPRIKPLLLVPEKESALHALINHIPAYFVECPYAKFNSLRRETRDFLNRLENRSPGIKYSIIKSAERVASLLKAELKFGEINSCSNCGEPCSGDLCKTCETMKTFFG